MPACRIYTHICILNSCVYVTLQTRQAGHLPDIQLHWHRGEKTEYCCKHNHRFAQWQDKGKMDQYLFLGLQQLLVGTGSYKTRIRITFHQFVNVLLKGKEGAVTPQKKTYVKWEGITHVLAVECIPASTILARKSYGVAGCGSEAKAELLPILKAEIPPLSYV